MCVVREPGESLAVVSWNVSESHLEVGSECHFPSHNSRRWKMAVRRRYWNFSFLSETAVDTREVAGVEKAASVPTSISIPSIVVDLSHYPFFVHSVLGFQTLSYQFLLVFQDSEPRNGGRRLVRSSHEPLSWKHVGHNRGTEREFPPTQERGASGDRRTGSGESGKPTCPESRSEGICRHDRHLGKHACPARRPRE
ncbi:hypothetical protein BO99DRAFT_224569 [Aspergillus violaceofuscus CBS 115571]|uniref:Uncharacterized protein n=1 Tax=Aspergillus violaceofuscus (strain CBS 115571) TaxID=1450538 RepID=A0A2V5HM82_ASPV1|nr:hypothetical protein BO99DRAFT_224569 [Aspergillus violaceofuscus CBS 115571]